MGKTQEGNEEADLVLRFSPEQQEAVETLALVHAEVKANDHMGFIKDLLKAHGVSERDIRLCQFHYKSAFIHGWKHGVEHEKGKS